jgi:hypothetical protein
VKREATSPAYYIVIVELIAVLKNDVRMCVMYRCECIVSEKEKAQLHC